MPFKILLPLLSAAPVCQKVALSWSMENIFWGLQSIEVRLSIKVYPKINILDIRYGLYLVEAEINHLFFLETFLLINTHPKSVALTDRSGSSIALTSLKCIVILDNIVAVIL